jgi:hypothetical protein
MSWDKIHSNSIQAECTSERSDFKPLADGRVIAHFDVAATFDGGPDYFERWKIDTSSYSEPLVFNDRRYKEQIE